MLISWLIFPLVLAVLALGCGLLVERVSGVKLPGALVLPAGLAVMVVVGLFPIMSEATAPLTMPLLVLLAIAGLALGTPWRRRPFDPWAVACAVGVFVVYAAPIVLSGEPTLAAYLAQIDSSSWLGIADRIVDHGRSLSDVPNSNYSVLMASYLEGSYPLGSFVPLGAAHKLVAQDVAWLFQPYLAFLAAMLSLSLYALAAPLVPSRPVRAGVAFVASQPAILFALSLWAGIKELSGAWVLALVGALLALTLREKVGGRALIPIAMATAATLSTLSFAGGIWLVPVLIGALVLAVRLNGRAVALAQAATFLVFAALLSIPSLAVAGGFFAAATSDVVLGASDGGGLLFGLSWRQLFGIWPAGDFRTIPDAIELTNVLVGVVMIAAVAGFVWAWRRRAWELALYVGGVTVAGVIVGLFGSPWVDAKAFGIASPALLLGALVGAFAIPARFRRIGTPLVLVVMAGGVLWSNVEAYLNVYLAPRPELLELERIGEQIENEGPTLLTEYEPWGFRHFLAKAAPGGPSGGSVPIIARGGGVKVLPRTNHVNTEEYGVEGLLSYRTLVRRRSPLSSRPLSAYRLVWSGRYYEVWQRPRARGPQRIVDHLPLGTKVQPASKPACSTVLGMAHLAGRGGRLATVERPPVTGLDRPGVFWVEDSTEPGTPVPSDLRSGTIKGSVALPVTARYSFWLTGSFHRRVQLSVDGRRLGKPRTELVLSHNFWVPMGSTVLRAGSHKMEFRFGGPGFLHPASGGHAALATGLVKRSVLDFLPIVLSRDAEGFPVTAEGLPVTYVKSSRARTLCGKRLDWLEAIVPVR